MRKRISLVTSCFFLIFFYSFAHGQKKDTCHQVIRYLVDKKGIETGIIDTTGHCVKPCKGSFMRIIDKRPFLGRRKTHYDPCSGKWIKIEYYFLGILTRTRRNPDFDSTQ